MQFTIIAHDHDDAEALDRRLKARAEHIAYSDSAIPRGEQIMGAAMINDKGDMCGSIMIVDFPNREALNEWLENEAYITGKVWDPEKIDIIPCKVGPSFVSKAS